ncbi:MAG: hypothetical protein HYW45_01440 [Candidatus Daviesbacteria bacterium]|nr:MAG: hypothetical protein HYW45_01440 [Candidatus Daviesbacteria bacterium]
MLPRQNGSVTIVLLLFVIFAGLSGFLIYSIQPKSESTPALAQILNPTPSPTPSPWQTYSDPAGFSLTYPREGVVVEEHDYSWGECGKEVKNKDGLLLVDNFYKIKTVEWAGTLDDYLIQVGAKDSYETKSLEGSGADEALVLLRLKEGFEIAVGYPPLAFTKAVFKKGEQVYLMQIFNVVNNFGGCILPGIADPVRFNNYHQFNWDIIHSLKF